MRLADGLHGDSFLTHAVAEVVELGAAHLTAGHYFNLGNLGGVGGEGAFHAFAVGNLTNGESLVDAGATLGNDDALEDRHAFLAIRKNIGYSVPEGQPLYNFREYNGYTMGIAGEKKD